MKAPKLWVWVGSPDDKLDVLRYVSATEKDIRNQPVVERLREQDRASRELLAQHDEAYEQVMVRAEAAEAEAEELTAEVEQLRANAASAQSCPSCGYLLPEHAPECGRYPLVVAELRAEVERLRAWASKRACETPKICPVASGASATCLIDCGECEPCKARKPKEG